MKFCKRCGEDKEEEKFSKSRCTKDGLQQWCKDCMLNYGKSKENRHIFNENRKRRRKEGYYVNVEKPKRRDFRLKNLETYLWRSCRDRAKKYNLPFEIAVEDIIIPTHCPLLEIPLIKTNIKSKDSSPSLDKIIPELGYVKGNVRVISVKANWMKSNATKEELQTFYKNIFNYLDKT